MNYGQGSVWGFLSSEVATIGLPSLIAENQSFIKVYASKDLWNLWADGILGLAFSNLTRSGLPLIENLYKQKRIEKPIFSFFLGNDWVTDHNKLYPSECTIGDYNLEKYAESKTIEWISLYDRRGYWSVRLSQIAVYDEPIRSRSIVGILDTGSSVIIAPQSEGQAVLQRISTRNDCIYDSGLLTCKCPHLGTFPNITYTLDGKKFMIEPIDYLMPSGYGNCVVLIQMLPKKFK